MSENHMVADWTILKRRFVNDNWKHLAKTYAWVSHSNPVHSRQHFQVEYVGFIAEHVKTGKRDIFAEIIDILNVTFFFIERFCKFTDLKFLYIIWIFFQKIFYDHWFLTNTWGEFLKKTFA